jgi:hypothetical protein
MNQGCVLFLSFFFLVYADWKYMLLFQCCGLSHNDNLFLLGSSCDAIMVYGGFFWSTYYYDHQTLFIVKFFRTFNLRLYSLFGAQYSLFVFWTGPRAGPNTFYARRKELRAPPRRIRPRASPQLPTSSLLGSATLLQFSRVPINQGTFQMSLTASSYDAGQLITRIRTKCRFLTPTTEKSWQSPLLGR